MNKLHTIFSATGLIRISQAVTLRYSRICLFFNDMGYGAMRLNFISKWAFFLAALLCSFSLFAKGLAPLDEIKVAELPREAQHTLVLIKQGGPFPYPKDGRVFGNYERILPKQKRGYYQEFTVKTPGARNRGARRIVSGGNPTSSGEYYYTDDHYATFRRIRE